MYLKSLAFQDLHTGWTLESAQFDRFNLLVGNTGVGKTKILGSLLDVASLAFGERDALPTYQFAGLSWAMEFSIETREYHWSGRARWSMIGDKFEEEELRHGDGSIFKRDEQHFLFRGQSLPLLNPELSGLRLLAGEREIAPIVAAMKHVTRAIALPPSVLSTRHPPEFQRSFASFADFQKSVHAYHPLETAFVLQKRFPEVWLRIHELFCSIFPSVQGLDVSYLDDGDGYQAIELSLEEHGASAKIAHGDISSGMRHTLSYLVNLAVAPPGSIILIDEFENSLGANCMPDVVRFLNTRPDIQFILTSHHPYVINNLPIATWKLVRRRGSVVSVTPAHDIPALQGASHHQAFVRLINAPEYEEGIS